MNRDSLRSKQNMEILDVFQNLRSQIVDRQKKQIAVFPESVLPKTQRDMAVEVNIDKGIEGLNRLLEVKLGALEYFVQNIKVENRGMRGAMSEKAIILPYSQAYQQVTTTGELVQAWNAIVRGYQTQGLSKQSQEIIKVKLQELKGNLEAMKYGLRSGIQAIFEYKVIDAQVALKILELLRALSAYTLISSQSDSGSLELINVERLNSAYKNIFDSLSLEQIHILQQHSKPGNVIDTPIRNVPYFGVEGSVERLKRIADELGIKIPQDLMMKLARLPKQDAEIELNKIRNELGPGHAQFSEQDTRMVSEMDRLGRQLIDVKNNIAEVELELKEIEEQAYRLDEEPVPAEPSEELPDLQPPEFPNFDDFGGGVEGTDFRNAVKVYELGRRLHFEAMRKHLKARLDLENFHLKNPQRREERRQDYLRQIDELKNQLSGLEDSKYVIEQEIDDLGNNITAERSVYSDRALEAANLIVSAAQGKSLKLNKKTRAKYFNRKKGREESESDEEKHGSESESDNEIEVSGRGKNMDTRGLSSLRANYGTVAEPPMSKKAMHFDDTRNDNFCSRPM